MKLAVTGLACLFAAALGAIADSSFTLPHADEARHARFACTNGAPGDSETVDDYTIRRRIEREGEALFDGGLGRTARELCDNVANASAPLPVGGERELSPAQTYAQCRDGVLVVRGLYHCDKCHHWHTSSGATAFVLTEDGVCVTNQHVFGHDDEDHPSRMVVATADGAVYVVERLLAAAKTDDVAIFRLGAGRKDGKEIAAGATKFHALPLCSNAPIGTPVSLIAHPDNECYTFTTGTVSRYVQQRDRADAPTVPRLCVTCEYGVGSSGGPILDSRGRAVGMVCDTHTVYAGEGRRREPQMVVRHCVPASRILMVMSGEDEKPDDTPGEKPDEHDPHR